MCISRYFGAFTHHLNCFYRLFFMDVKKGISNWCSVQKRRIFNHFSVISDPAKTSLLTLPEIIHKLQGIPFSVNYPLFCSVSLVYVFNVCWRRSAKTKSIETNELHMGYTLLIFVPALCTALLPVLIPIQAVYASPGAACEKYVR